MKNLICNCDHKHKCIGSDLIHTLSLEIFKKTDLDMNRSKRQIYVIIKQEAVVVFY